MAVPSSRPSPVQHNIAAQRHEIVVGGELAVVDHPRVGNRVVFTHTFVPPALRGKGLAEQLVGTALTWARTEGLRISVECSYVERFIQLHPEFADLVDS